MKDYYAVYEGYCEVCLAKKRENRKKEARFRIEGVLHCQKHANKWFIKQRTWENRSPNDFKRKKRTLPARVYKLRTNATPAERCYRGKLKKTGIEFKFQRGFIKGRGYAIVDFYVPSKKFCIEIDGKYHDTHEQRKKDEWRDNWLRTERKVSVIRISNEQAMAITVEDIKFLVRTGELRPLTVELKSVHSGGFTYNVPQGNSDSLWKKEDQVKV